MAGRSGVPADQYSDGYSDIVANAHTNLYAVSHADTQAFSNPMIAAG